MLETNLRRETAPDRRLLFGVQLDALRMDEAVDRCHQAMLTRRPLLIGVVNAAKIVNMRRDPQLQEAVLDCDMVLADGQSVVWASKLLRRPLPERVAGIDLFEQLLDLAHRQRRSIYLLGAKPEVLAALTRKIATRWPDLRIAGSQHGYYDETQAEEVAAQISASGADMLFLGMASPRKEIFLKRFRHHLGVPILHGVGGSFDVMAGLTRRAPRSWQRLGLEWAYRLMQEPGRMWKRYLVTNTAFVALTVREALHPARALSTPPAAPPPRLSA